MIEHEMKRKHRAASSAPNIYGKGSNIMQGGLQVLPDVVMLRLFCSPDPSIGDMFEKAAERAISLDNRKVLVDFSDAGPLDPVGLMLCSYGLYHLRQLQIPVALISPPASLFPVLRQHGLHDLPPVFSHEWDARMKN